MYFESISDALTMAGHGPYVWASYGITLAVLAALVINPIQRQRSARRTIAAEVRRRNAAQPKETQDASKA